MSRFELTEFGTVIDNWTGLEWQAKATGPMTWGEAMKYAKSLGDGWRLPSCSELYSLVNLEKCDPASDFPDMLCKTFWSSSVSASHSSYAWIVFLDYGYVSDRDKGGNNYVHCVRKTKQEKRKSVKTLTELKKQYNQTITAIRALLTQKE